MSVDMNRSGGSRNNNYSQDQMESNQNNNSRNNNDVDPNGQTMANLQSSNGRHSIVNLSDALDAGSAMDKQKSMRKIKEKMKTLTRTLYNPDSDPQFYLFLNRLADAEEFKKTDRIDGRRALNDFIVDHDSLIHVKGVQKADQVKKQHQEEQKAKGLWKEEDDDPFTNLKQTFTNMVDGKQTMEEPTPKLIDIKEMGRDVRTKNIIKAQPTVNRKKNDLSPDAVQSELASPSHTLPDEQPMPATLENSPTVTKTARLMNADLEGLNQTQKSPPTSIAAALSGTKALEKLGKSINNGMTRTGQGVADQQQSKTVVNQMQQQKLAQSPSLDLTSQNMQSYQNIHQSTKALGISTLQLDPDVSLQNPAVSKRATNMSGLGASSSAQKGKMLRGTRSLISRIQIPAMDKEKAKQFNIKSTLNLSERSPLIQAEKTNMYARMPTIFARNRGNDDSETESNSVRQINMMPNVSAISQASITNPIATIKQLVEEGGSAAYQLYQQQSEKMLRDRLIEQNSGVFLANVESIKLARNESISKVLVPRNFTHDNTIAPMLPQGFNETALEREIKKIVERQNASLDNSVAQRRITVAGYEDMKLRLSPRAARLTSHAGHEQYKDNVNSQLNVMYRIEQQVSKNEQKRRDSQLKENSFGLGQSFIQRKRSVQPLATGSMLTVGGGGQSSNLSPIKQMSNERSDAAINTHDKSWIDSRFVVIFAKDGDTLGECKSFKMNIQELIQKYAIVKPKHMLHVTKEHLALQAQFEKRAYKELLEYCSLHMLDNEDQMVEPEDRQIFKTIYTMDGTRLENLKDLKLYCEEPNQAREKKKIRLNDDDRSEMSPSDLNAKSPTSATKIMHNKASFIFNPLQNDLKTLADDKDHLHQALDSSSPRHASHGIIPNLVVNHQGQSSLMSNGSSGLGNTLLLNKSSTNNMLPQITRNETEMHSLRQTTLRVEQQEEIEKKNQPKILLLSLNKLDFQGLTIPAEFDEEAEKKDNAKKIKDQFQRLNNDKANELYLEWLERNQETVDLANRKMSLNLRANDQALQYSNSKQRTNLRNNMTTRRYTTNASLAPPSLRPPVTERPGKFAGEAEQPYVSQFSMASLGQRHFSQHQSHVSMPVDIEFERDTGPLQQGSYISGKWRSRAVLKALDGVKRGELFNNLRNANESNTISRRMAVLNGSPNVLVKKKQPAPLLGVISQALPSVGQAYSSQQLLNSDPMKPPTLRQLRMEIVQRQIIEKTNAGMPIGTQAIDNSNVVIRGMAARNAQFGTSKLGTTLGSSTKGGFSQRAGGNADLNQNSQQQKNLTYDEVKSLSDEYFLPCKNVYELHAEFNSLMNVANQEKLIQKELNGGVGADDDRNNMQRDIGIPTDYFLRNTNYLKDKHLNIQHAILQAMGIHTQNKTVPNITWIQFLRMATLMSYHSATKAQYIDFWMRFISPQVTKFVTEEEFNERIELLARGSFTDSETLVSVNYARGLYQVLSALNCLSKEEKSVGDINMNKLKKRLNSETLHIEYLNQTLKKDCEFILDEDQMAEGEIKIRKLKATLLEGGINESQSSKTTVKA